MSDTHSFDGIAGLKQSETDIRHIFNRHIKTLFDAKWKISDEMTEWSKTLINQIQEHVTEQKDLLEKQYATKVSNLTALRDQMVEQALRYEEKKDTEHLQEIVGRCDTLKVELAALVYVNLPIISIKLITDEQSLKEIIGNSPTDENTAAKSPITDVPTKSPPNDEDSSIHTDEKLETAHLRRDHSIDKCPICYMIFPQSMTVHNRNLHVNEHYNDH